ncbi:MAG: hypothetical protein LUE93_02735 [Bacteroides sp.]|nr:hypothetical protein [Bacteroides sp.]
MKTSGKNFLTILSDYQDIIHKVNLIYLHTPKAREENFQDIVCQLRESFPSLKGEEKITCWVYAISFNTSLVLVKKRREYSPEKYPSPRDTLPGPGEAFKQLLAAIRTLHDIDRALLLLYLEDHSCRQISNIAGISCPEIEEKLVKIASRLPGTREELKTTWQHEVSAAIHPYTREQLAHIIARSIRITLRNHYPQHLLIFATLLFTGYLVWKATTQTYSMSLTAFYGALTTLSVSTLLLTGWSARKIRTYPPLLFRERVAEILHRLDRPDPAIQEKIRSPTLYRHPAARNRHSRPLLLPGKPLLQYILFPGSYHPAHHPALYPYLSPERILLQNPPFPGGSLPAINKQRVEKDHRALPTHIDFYG